MFTTWCWKLGHAYCGFGDEEDLKPGLISDPEWEEDEIAKEAFEYRRTSSRIEELETSIAERVRERQERKRRLTVFAKQIVATECPKTIPKSEEELAFLSRVLEEDRNFIFCDFTEKERGFMLDVLRKEDSFQKGDIIFRHGDVGEIFYIIEQGSVDVLEGHNTGKITTKTLERGDSFGEVALLFEAPRTTTVIAKTDCVLWEIHQFSFRAKIAHHALKNEEEMIGLLRRVSLFKNIEEAALRKFAHSMELVHFPANERIVNKGDEGRVFYIIESGEVRVHGIGAGDSQSLDLIKKKGEWLGERSLLTGEPQYAHATAQTEVSAWAVDRETFETSFGPLQKVLEHQMKKGFLTAIPVFAESSINALEMDELAEKMMELCFEAGHHFDQVGKPHRQDLIIMRHGKIVVYDGTQADGSTVFTLKNGDYYGDKHIRDERPKPSRSNVVCEEDTCVWLITKQDLRDVIGDLNRLGRSVSFQVKRRVSSYTRHIPQKELSRVKLLGHGGFGKVWLVQHKRTRAFYALKELNKRRILDKGQTANVLREKRILSLLNHPFIAREVSSFQDESNCYIIMDLIEGGELYTRIVNTKGKGLPLHDATFYIACVQCALAHFHARLIAYRDLKPENVMIGRDGYCVIVDLGFCKVVTTRTFTLCGTPEYLAPEILLSKGHDKSADLWSFGVLIFEMITSQSAFYKPGRAQVDMFKHIVRAAYELPTSVNAATGDLIQKLLVKNPSLRLGNLSNGAQEICDHPMFDGLDWKALLNKKMPAPWLPVIKKNEGVAKTSYDGGYKEISLGRPLTKEEQSIFKSFSENT